MNDIITKIQRLFLNEADQSPLLFNDLASMEKYISESYVERSLIELLQNADDASATSFYVESCKNGIYIVANNGRKFTDEDILSLCRSGASTKKRKSTTIGYRGIGFKSVVNYAQTVHLWSGEIHATFSRELTKQLVPNADNVPLIRIPHVFHGHQYIDLINKQLEKGYKTIFVFETSNDSLLREIDSFDASCLLFLRHVRKIVFKVHDTERVYQSESIHISDNQVECTVNNGREAKKWLIISQNSSICATAFLLDNQKAIDASFRESVVHSFMPTLDELTMHIKVNGDFSTDPSRTRVVMDDDSRQAAEQCGKILSTIVINALCTQKDQYGVINILKNAETDPLSQIRGERVNDVIVNEMKKEVAKFIRTNIQKEIYLQPQGINDDDFRAIAVALKIYGIGNKEEQAIPGMLKCLRQLGIQELPLEKSLVALKTVNASDNTRAQIIVDCINKTRFGMSSKVKQELKSSRLFKFNSGIKPLNSLRSSDVINSGFESLILEKLTTSSDYTIFAKKLGIPNKSLALSHNESTSEHRLSITGKEIQGTPKEFHLKQTIHKWRSAEKNVTSILAAIDGVSEAHDVSLQNVGYDIEVVMNDGSHRYYEVKSVDCMGSEFTMTNNEYSTASEYKNSYYIAVVCQDSSTLEICFIQNPITKLNLSRRVTRWEWLCHAYSGDVFNISLEDE